MEKDEMKELIKRGEYDQILQYDQLRVSNGHTLKYTVLAFINSIVL
jgi:hypothetical protein